MTEQPEHVLAFGDATVVDDRFYDDGVPGYTVGGWAAIAPVGDDCALICWQSSYPTPEGLVGRVVRWLPPSAEIPMPTVEMGPRTILGVSSAFNSNSSLASIISASQVVAFNQTVMSRIAVDTTTLTASLIEASSIGVPTIFGSMACEADPDRAIFWGGTGSTSTGTRFLVVVDASTYALTSVPPSGGGPIAADATQVVRTNWSDLTIWRHQLNGLSASAAENLVTAPRLVTDHTVGLASPGDAVFSSLLVGGVNEFHHYDPATGQLTGPIEPTLPGGSVTPTNWQAAPTPMEATVLRYRKSNGFYAAVVAGDDVTTSTIGVVQAQSGDTAAGGRRWVHLGNSRYLHLEVPVNENSGAEVIRRQAWVRPGYMPTFVPPVSPTIIGQQIGSRRRFTPG